MPGRLTWTRKEKKVKDYAFRGQCNEKPTIIPGCPDADMDYTVY